MRYRSLKLAFLVSSIIVGFALLFVYRHAIQVSRWPEMVILSGLLYFAFSCALPLRYGRIELSVTNTLFVLGILMLGPTTAYVCFATCLIWKFPGCRRYFAERDFTSVLVFFWGLVRMVPILLLSNWVYLKTGGGSFAGFSHIPWLPVAALIATIFFLDWASCNLYVAFSEGMAPWRIAVPLSGMFDVPFAPLAVPLYLGYLGGGFVALLMFSIPIAGCIWLSRRFLLVSAKKDESLELLDMANSLIHSNLSLSQMLDWVAVRVGGILHADGVEIYLSGENGLNLRAVHGETPWDKAKPDPFFLRALEKMEVDSPQVLSGPGGDDGLSRYSEKGFHSLFAFPLISRSRTIGCILCSKKEKRYFHQQQVDTTRVLVAQLSNAVVSVQLHEELQNAHDELVQSKKMAGLGKLAAGVAHEINNPLLSILLNAESLLGKAEDAESVDLIISSAKRCKSIVEQLLFFSRQVRSDQSKIGVREAVEECVRVLRKQDRFSGIDVKTQVIGNPCVNGKSVGLTQVLSNLVSNAVDAIHESGRDGVIRLEAFEMPDKVLVKIKDNGCGIPGEHLDRIYDPFFTTKSVGKGTGLGLWVTYGIVAGMGGKIEVKSRPHSGTTFYLEFPNPKPSPARVPQEPANSGRQMLAV